ncbi:MAG: hypothetical protein ABIF11_07215 [Nitrospirota bacterium]
MRKEFIQGLLCGVVATTLFFGISSLIHKEPEENKKTITHIQMVKEPLKKGIAEVFYPEGNETQNRLADKILDILVKEYELVSKVLEIPEDKILSYQTYGLVFCEDIEACLVDDMFLKYTHDGLILVDGVQCYPVVGETGFPFRAPKTRFRLVHSLPQELVKGILSEKLKVEDSGRWFIEGVGGYIGFLCWQRFDKSAFFNYEYPRVLKLFDKAQQRGEPPTIDLTATRQASSETFKEDDLLGCASTFIIIDLVNRYGRGIIAKSISKLAETRQASSKEKIGAEEIAGVINELTGADILPGLKVVSVKRVEERFKLLKTKLLPQR